MVCSWCGKEISPADNTPLVAHSHGICHECAKRELAAGIKVARRLKRDLDAYVDAQADKRPGPVEHTLSILYGVPLTISQVF